MEEPTAIHSTFVIERHYPAPRERVFDAFADPSKKRLWFAVGHNHEVKLFEMDFQVGGAERTRYILKPGTPFPGKLLTNEAIYYDIVPNRRIVIASSMTFGDTRISASLSTFEFLSTEQGTDLIFTHQGAFFEGADGSERREAGWRNLLDRLQEALPVQ